MKRGSRPTLRVRVSRTSFPSQTVYLNFFDLGNPEHNTPNLGTPPSIESLSPCLQPMNGIQLSWHGVGVGVFCLYIQFHSLTTTPRLASVHGFHAFVSVSLCLCQRHRSRTCHFIKTQRPLQAVASSIRDVWCPGHELHPAREHSQSTARVPFFAFIDEVEQCFRFSTSPFLTSDLPTTSPITSTTSRLASTPSTSRLPPPSPPSHHIKIERRGASKANRLLAAELGGTLGGALFLLLLAILVIFLWRRRRRQNEARLPHRQVQPFVVNPTWVTGSPRTPTAPSHLSLPLPNRALQPSAPIAHQMTSLPNLSQQYRSRRVVVVRPRASTVGSSTANLSEFHARSGSRISISLPRNRDRGREDGLAGREGHGEGEEDSDDDSDLAATAAGAASHSHSHSESSVWRPRIDILAARHQQQQSRVDGASGSGSGQMHSFWTRE
ncbi:hypothetical protein R3P38DRAFT_3355850 [Favolaschia claudopus]|uniref:Uncharacterized protein n=1 Tax=Favolaschia claudopus TaxID=2862362 RepID=A0AAW0BKH6_9AGAR